MPRFRPRSLLLALAGFAIVPGPLLAQSGYGNYEPYRPGAPVTYGTDYTTGRSLAPAPLSQEELDALLAPIALYPDQLLAQVLMAATFPLDVVEAARFVKQNPGLRGAALDDALATRPWDPSVLSLAAFPQVLDMMSERLDWTRRLGDAFVSDQDRVMWTVQELRRRARDNGTLLGTPQQSVIVEGGTILIEPAQPDVIYVPVYNPTVVYGPWWAPSYQPFYWRPASNYYSGVVTTGVVGFGIGYLVGSSHWGWARPDWRDRRITVDVRRPNRFLERRPNYREAFRDGVWRYREDPRRDARPGGGSRDHRRPYRPIAAEGDSTAERVVGKVRRRCAWRPSGARCRRSRRSRSAPAATKPGWARRLRRHACAAAHPRHRHLRPPVPHPPRRPARRASAGMPSPPRRPPRQPRARRLPGPRHRPGPPHQPGPSAASRRLRPRRRASPATSRACADGARLHALPVEKPHRRPHQVTRGRRER